MSKIGIMGGTFDPIHFGHLKIASCAKSEYHLDKVIFLTSGNPPHKRDKQILDAEKAVLTGKKLEDKYYYHHSGYIGGMKKVQAKTMMATKPEYAMELAIKGMLPKNKLGDKAFTRLKVYAGEAHKHEAQKPEAYEI